jgi:hypothetical protein
VSENVKSSEVLPIFYTQLSAGFECARTICIAQAYFLRSLAKAVTRCGGINDVQHMLNTTEDITRTRSYNGNPPQQDIPLWDVVSAHASMQEQVPTIRQIHQLAEAYFRGDDLNREDFRDSQQHLVGLSSAADRKARGQKYLSPEHKHKELAPDNSKAVDLETQAVQARLELCRAIAQAQAEILGRMKRILDALREDWRTTGSSGSHPFKRIQAELRKVHNMVAPVSTGDTSVPDPSLALLCGTTFYELWMDQQAKTPTMDVFLDSIKPEEPRTILSATPYILRGMRAVQIYLHGARGKDVGMVDPDAIPIRLERVPG